MIWENSRISQDSNINDFGRKLLELCILFGLLLVNGCPPWDSVGKFTYVSQHGHSVVDYFLMSSALSRCVQNLTVEDRIESDHMPVELHCTFYTDANLNECNKTQSRKEKIIWREEKVNDFKAYITSSEFKEHIEKASDKMNECIDTSIQMFTHALLSADSCMKKTVTVGSSPEHRSPWFDAECRQMKKEVRKCLRHFRKSKDPEDYSVYGRKRKAYKQLVQKKKNDERNARIGVLLDSMNNPKDFWGEIKKYRRRTCTKNDISQDEWTDHFCKVFNEISQVHTGDETDDESVDESYDDILDADISEMEVKKAIQHLKCGKAAGPDDILAEMIKTAEHEITPYLTKYFNVLFARAKFPLEWSKAIIIPLHKKGDVNDPGNYRGISLLSILSKVYTHIINSRLTLWVESNFVLTDAQAGFRKGRSTVDHIFTLHAAIERQFANNSKLYVAFIDFKKAYDSVNRNILWSVLLRSGIQGKMLRTIKAMYASVQACVKSNATTDLSVFFHCLQGLKQGCIASPILFSLLVNELANEIFAKARHGIPLGPTDIELFLLLFADDLTLLASTVIGLQNQLNVLSVAAERLCLTVNLDKSKVIVFRKGGFLAAKEKLFLGGAVLEVVNKYKYLGLTFSTGHSFAAAMEDTSIRAKKNTLEVLRALKKISCNSPEVFFKLFGAQIVPTLLYAAEIWGYRNYEQIERVHLFACKKFLHVRNKTPNDVVYGELGRYPLFITATVRFIKYWLKLLMQQDNFYSRKAYKMLLALHNRGKTTWVSHVKLVLSTNGFEQVWLFGCGNVKPFIKELEERLRSSFCHRWCNHLDTSERLSVYNSYKHCFQRERYVDVLWMEVYRNCLAQFRMGVSQINLHRHRFSTITDNTTCPFCATQQETEIHFVFQCPVYNQLRSKYLPDIINVRDPRKHLIILMDSSSQEEIINVAKFLVCAFNLRSSKLDANT